ncbi:MAG: glycoside hydrolase family 20 zincin-like fold domain-containing protein, partial [Planctomycetota bacterium]
MIKQKKVLFGAALIICAAFVGSPLAKAASECSETISVIPKPMEMKQGSGTFVLKHTTAIYYQSGCCEVKKVAKYLGECIRPATGIGLVVLEEGKSKPFPNSFFLTTENADSSLG